MMCWLFKKVQKELMPECYKHCLLWGFTWLKISLKTEVIYRGNEFTEHLHVGIISLALVGFLYSIANK